MIWKWVWRSLFRSDLLTFLFSRNCKKNVHELKVFNIHPFFYKGYFLWVNQNLIAKWDLKINMNFITSYRDRFSQKTFLKSLKPPNKIFYLFFFLSLHILSFYECLPLHPLSNSTSPLKTLHLLTSLIFWLFNDLVSKTCCMNTNSREWNEKEKQFRWNKFYTLDINQFECTTQTPGEC